MAKRLFFLALLIPFAAAAAKAGERPVLLTAAVARDPKLEVFAAQISYILDSAARRSQRFDLVELAERLDPEGTKKRRTWQESAADAADQAKKAYDLMEYRDGLSYIQRSVELYENTYLPQTFRGLSASLVLRVASRYFDGDEQGARMELERLLTVDPRAEFDPQRFPPDLRETVERMKEERKSAARMVLDLSTEPAPARAYIDGIYRGITPLAVKGLSPGEHYVTLVAPGYELQQEKVKVAPGTAHRVTLRPLPAGPTMAFMKKLPGAYGQPDGLSVVRALGRVVQAAQVMTAFVEYAGRDVRVALWRIEVRDGHLAAEGEVAAPESDPQLPAKLDRMFAEAIAKDAPRGEKGAPVLVSRRNVLQRIAGEVGLDKNTGQTIALVSTGALALSWVVFGALAMNANAEYRRVPQTDDRVTAMQESGRGLAVTADVMLGLTLVGGTAWAVLRYGWPWEWPAREALPP
jgi:hypothetical protein